MSDIKLTGFESLTDPYRFSRTVYGIPNSQLENHIVTGGSLATISSERLASDNLTFVESEVRTLLSGSIVHPSHTLWESPLRMTLRENITTWQPYSGYRSLAAVARFDSYPVPQKYNITVSLRGTTVFKTRFSVSILSGLSLH